MRFPVLALPAAVVFALAACADSPSAPSSSPGPSSPAPQISVSCPEFGEGFRCSAFARSEAESRDVTGFATWSTSDPTIASINSTGLVSAVATGEVAIRATYQGGAGFLNVWAVPGQGLHGTYRALQGVVLSMNGPLPDVTMEILSGPNAGRKMTTFGTGAFYMDGLQDGAFTIRLSKPGYRTAEYSWRIPGGRERTPTLSTS